VNFRYLRFSLNVLSISLSGPSSEHSGRSLAGYCRLAHPYTRNAIRRP
jgi:hypothetical protein